jgi:hypothetical protein
LTLELPSQRHNAFPPITPEPRAKQRIVILLGFPARPMSSGLCGDERHPVVP